MNNTAKQRSEKLHVSDAIFHIIEIFKEYFCKKLHTEYQTKRQTIT